MSTATVLTEGPAREPLVDVHQAAAILRKSPCTIRRYCRSGFLAGAWQVGRGWNIPERSVAALRTDHPRSGLRRPT